MPTQTAESLIRALRESGLVPAAEFDRLAAELARPGAQPRVVTRALVDRGLVTVYQLRKVFHGRAAELFVGPYVVLDKLGEGGMGKVFRARHRSSRREVALKVVRADLLANPVVRGRYEREVEASLVLRHPHIVSVHSAGETDGRFYLEMEFVDGVDLAHLVRTYGVLSVPEACEYVRQAALGLHYAHEQGFVHRDIKPSNVVVSGERHVPEATGPAHVKILDMGLVRSVGFDDGPGGVDLTRAGTVVGTPDYMAPEQAKNSHAVDRRADLYGLGGTFYFLLTGQPPFPAASPVEKILKHQLDPPPPLQAARPDVPEELARVVTRLMAKSPDDRYATAGELAEVLAPLTRLTGRAVPVTYRPADAACSGADTLPPSSHTVVPSSPDASKTPPDSPRRKPRPKSPPGKAPVGPPAQPARSGGRSRPRPGPTPRPAEPSRRGRRIRPVAVMVAILVAMVMIAGAVLIALTGWSN